MGDSKVGHAHSQVFTNWERGYEHVHSMYAKGITCTQKLMHSINSSVLKKIEFASVFVFFSCLLLGCLFLFILFSCLHPLCCAIFFVYMFLMKPFFSPVIINQTSLSNLDWWFSFIHISFHIFDQSENWFNWIKIFSIEELKQVLQMILSCSNTCKGHELQNLLTVLVHWWYQPVTIEKYLSPAHTDHCAVRK